MAEVVCVACGLADGPSLTWVSQTAPDGQQEWLCGACARAHLRSIEARLDQEWW